MKIDVCVWIVLAGCFALVSSQMPPGFNLPSILHVDRNWYVMSTDPIGSLVTRVQRERHSNTQVTFGLESSGPPVPFKIDPKTGVVTVNDTLIDKENRSYSLWVTAYDGSIPQRTEVLASVTDNTGQRPKLPHPPPFALPDYPSLTLRPSFPRPPQRTTTTQKYVEEVTVPETTTEKILSPPNRPDDVPNISENIIDKDENRNNNSDASNKPVEETPVGADVPLTVIPLVAIAGLVVIVAAVIIFVWRKNRSEKQRSKKEDMSKDSTGIVLQDATLNLWDRPLVYSNRYESWDNNHLQLSEETTITKEEPRDEWEFPRHRLRIFNIVGEGAFGQVWRAQAIDIDGKKGEQTVAVKTLKENASEKEKADLIQELNVMKGLGTHPNVVRLIGCCTEKILVALSFYATGSYQRFVGATHGTMMSQQSVSRAIQEVTEALNNEVIVKKWLKFPQTRQERDSIKQRFYEKYKIPSVIGAIDGTHVAIIRPSANEERFYNRKGFHSRNVLIEPTLVIMEFVSLGKLQQFLRDSRAERHYGNTHAGSQFLTSRDLTHFAYQVARGMDFLSSKGIIHRDLAARNVLITEERTCKVADFGFARDVAGTHVYERKSDGRLPIRWMAPESLYDDIFCVKSDVWSFGVLLWEIVTLGSTPYPGLSAGDVMRKVREGHRLEKPEHCRRELYNIMYYCWEAEPTSRPDFPEVVTMLERLLCTETDYIELERFPDHSYYNLQQLDGEKV